MNYLSVHNIDFVRVREVLQKKRTGRQCGKTIATVMLLISYAVNARGVGNSARAYLFVANDQTNAQDTLRLTALLLDELGFDVGFEDAVAVGTLASMSVQRYGIIGNAIVAGYQGQDFTFAFHGLNTALPNFIRGHRFNRVFIDVAPEVAARFPDELHIVRHSVRP